jgi:hypothetical protein
MKLLKFVRRTERSMSRLRIDSMVMEEVDIRYGKESLRNNSKKI